MADYDGSNKILQRLKKENRMNSLAVSVNSHLCRRFENCDEAIELLIESADAPQYNIMERQMLRFDIGHLLDKLKRYDEAFDWFKKANDTVAIESQLEINHPTD